MTLEDSGTGFADSVAALSALNTVRHFVGLMSVDGTLLEANTAALSAGGLHRDDVVGKPFWEAGWWSYDPAVQAQLRDAIQRAAKGECVRYEVEVRAAGSGAVLLPIDFSLTPLVDRRGVVNYLVPEGHPLADPADAETSLPWAELVAEAGLARADAEQIRSLAAALAAVYGLGPVVSVVLEQLPVTLGIEFANVAIVADDGAVTLHHPGHLQSEVAGRWDVLQASERTPLTDVIRTGVAVVVCDRAALQQRYPAMVVDSDASGLECLAAYPVLDRAGSVQAAIGLGSARPEAIDLDRFAPVLALCGAALQRAMTVSRLSRTAALLDTLIRQAPVGLAFLDHNLRFALVNDLLAEVNGSSAEDHIGKTVGEVVPDLADQLVPMLQSALDTATAVTGLRISGTTPGTGGRVREWDESFYPIETADGDVIGLGIIVEDVTDRLSKERELASLAERLQLALSVSKAGVFVWSPDTGAVGWTPDFANLYGIDAGDVPSVAQLLEAVHPDDRPKLVEMTRALLKGDNDSELEYRIRHRILGERWIHSVRHVRRHTDGSVDDVLGMDTDISERKQREFELADLHASQRRIAARLQAGLLPTALADIEGYDTSFRYLPGSDGLSVGGDWYDIIPVSSDDVALVVGDVVGHDLDAAIAMAQVRHATIGLSFAHSDPAAVLADLDHLATLNPTIFGSTLFYGRLNPRTGLLRYVLGGHHQPVIVVPGHPAVLLDAPPGTPLGVPSDRPVAQLLLQPGHTLIAYTDGLIEHRSESIAAGQQRLLHAVQDVASNLSLNDLTQQLVSEVPHPERNDDIALLAIRRQNTSL